MVNVKSTLTYVVISTFFILIFGELISVFIADNPVFLQHWLAIFIYYLFITFIFSLFIFRIPPLFVPLIFFLCGVIMETFVFRNIKGLTDILGVLFFGIQYIALFGVPYIITKKFIKTNI